MTVLTAGIYNGLKSSAVHVDAKLPVFSGIAFRTSQPSAGVNCHDKGIENEGTEITSYCNWREREGKGKNWLCSL